MTTFANVGGVADPRLGNEPDYIGSSYDTPTHAPAKGDVRRASLVYTDSSIPFEEYLWWAGKSREYEKSLSTSSTGIQGVIQMMIGQKKTAKEDHIIGVPPKSGLEQPSALPDKAAHADGESPNEKSSRASDSSPQTDQYGISHDEWYNAQRAVRTATWGSVFYLITTDILGPYSVPWAISQMGYGPGAALYIVFGLLAAYSGAQLWKQFCGLDSTKYPLRNYGDLAFRIYGNWARILTNVLQSFQFFLNVALLIESNGQGLAQMAAGVNGTGYICFVVAEVVFMLCGFLFGQIRTLQRLSWLANLAVWLNVIVIIMTMVVTNVYPPNYAAALTTYNTPKGPVKTSAYWPEGLGLQDHINGLMQGVFSYGGATLFTELLAEMRRPYDFWKGLICAEIFIICVYITMGMVVYSAQGQFTYNPAYQGIPDSAYAWQTLGNAITFVTGIIAALLYGNIGVKVLYASVLRDLFHFPALDQKAGKWIWVAVIPIYWGLAFVVAAAIPQVSNLSAFVGAACILQFSYTFPPILMVGFNCQKDSIRPEEGFDPSTGAVVRHDSGWKRWARGYMQKWHINTLDVIYFLGALSVAGLGIYSSVISMHETFATTTLTPFTCVNPAG
ncbi:hypothetical protein LTR85_009111 [Meristemomyces frigidus]|nr:hypothetical protein LTR85_009111 [Meristemomyces frigidus]